MHGPHQAASDLRQLLDDAKHVVAFTGAGASAASGVPTYRGAGGSFARYDPSRYASIDYFRDEAGLLVRVPADQVLPLAVA